MSDTIRCPCGTQLRVGKNAQGATTVRCPKCQRHLRVKVSGTTPPRPAAAPRPPVSSAAASGGATIELRCGCGTRLRAPRTAVGKKVRCPKCQQPVPVRAPSPPAAVRRPDPTPWVTATPVEDQFDLDFPSAVPASPPAYAAPPAPARGHAWSFGAGGAASSPPYWTQQAGAPNISLKAGSPPTQVIRGGAIGLLVILSLTILCQVGFGVTMKISQAHAREFRSQRPTSMAESREFMERAQTLGRRYTNVMKAFHLGYRFLHAPALVAILACGIGLLMAVAEVRGGILVVLVVAAIVGLTVIVLDGLQRSFPLMLMTAGDRTADSMPADMWTVMLAMFGIRGSTAWTAGAIEALWGGFLLCLGLFSTMWRYSQNRGGLTLPILLSVGGLLYGLGMLGLAGSLASLEFGDARGVHLIVYIMLTILLWTLALFAVLVTHQDATRRTS